LPNGVLSMIKLPPDVASIGRTAAIRPSSTRAASSRHDQGGTGEAANGLFTARQSDDPRSIGRLKAQGTLGPNSRSVHLTTANAA
jgi:hypothetical protein